MLRCGIMKGGLIGTRITGTP